MGKGAHGVEGRLRARPAHRRPLRQVCSSGGELLEQKVDLWLLGGGWFGVRRVAGQQRPSVVVADGGHHGGGRLGGAGGRRLS